MTSTSPVSGVTGNREDPQERTEVDLDAAQLLVDAATRGDWYPNLGRGWTVMDSDFNQVAECSDYDDDSAAADANFIAASRSLVPSLIAELRALRGRLVDTLAERDVDLTYAREQRNYFQALAVCGHDGPDILAEALAAAKAALVDTQTELAEAKGLLAEAAEVMAEDDLWHKRAEHAKRMYHETLDRAAAEAAIGRVQALCDAAKVSTPIQPEGYALLPDDVLAALGAGVPEVQANNRICWHG